MVEATGGGLSDARDSRVAAAPTLGQVVYGDVPVLPGLERPEAWREHRQQVIDALGVTNAFQLALAERVALLLWRLKRAALYETVATTAVRTRTAVAKLTSPARRPAAPRSKKEGSADDAERAARLEEARDMLGWAEWVEDGLMSEPVQRRVAQAEAHLARQLALTLKWLRESQERSGRA